jgi:high-affinity Fe2+/Pb2+ permease
MKYIPRLLAGLFMAALMGMAVYGFAPPHGVAAADRPMVFMGTFMSIVCAFLLGWVTMAWDQEKMGD